MVPVHFTTNISRADSCFVSTRMMDKSVTGKTFKLKLSQTVFSTVIDKGIFNFTELEPSKYVHESSKIATSLSRPPS